MKTSVQWVKGEGTGGAAESFKDVKDLSHTLNLIESKQLVEWTRPADFEFDSDNPTKNLREGGSLAMLYDAAQAYLTPDTKPDLIRSVMLNGKNAGPL